MIRRSGWSSPIALALALALGLFASTGCDIEEAERMDLDRGGPRSILPELRNARLVDTAGLPVDTLRLFSSLDTLGHTDLYGTVPIARGLEVRGSLVDEDQDGDGIATWPAMRARWVYADGQAEPWVEPPLAYWPGNPSRGELREPVAIRPPLQAASWKSGPARFEFQIAERLYSFPIVIADDAPEVLDLRLAGGSDTIHARGTCFEARIRSPVTLLARTHKLLFTVLQGPGLGPESVIAEKVVELAPSSTTEVLGACGTWDWWHIPRVEGKLAVRVKAAHAVLAEKVFPAAL